MKGMQKVASLLMGVSALAFAATPGMISAPVTASAASLIPTGVDAAIVRAAAAIKAPTGGATVQNSGGGTEVIEIAEISKCIVKFFRPEELKIKHRKDHDDEDKWDGKSNWQRHEKDDRTVIQVQVKIICSDIVGDSELLIEQNDRLVVADTVRNHQTDVSLHSLTLKLNEEQEETFCVAVARNGFDGGLGGATTLGFDHTNGVVSQQCFDNLGEDSHRGH